MTNHKETTQVRADEVSRGTIFADGRRVQSVRLDPPFAYGREVHITFGIGFHSSKFGTRLDVNPGTLVEVEVR